MWDWVGIAGVLLAAVPLTLTLVRDFSRSKRLEQAMQLRDRAVEGSYARASLDRLVDLEAETMLIAAAKRRTQIWIALAYSVALYTAILGGQMWLAQQSEETESTVTGWGILGGVACWVFLATLWTWHQSKDVAAHRDVRALRAWKDRVNPS